MNKETAGKDNQTVALVTAHGWVGISTPVIMTATFLSQKGYMVDIFVADDEICTALGIGIPHLHEENIRIYKSRADTHMSVTPPPDIHISQDTLEFVSHYISPPRHYDWIIGFDPEGLARSGLLSSYWKVPYVYHSLEINDRSGPEKNAEKWFSQRAILTLTQDDVRANILSQLNGIKRNKIKIAYNSAFGEALPEKSDYFHKKFTIPKDKKIVLATGTLLPIHCVDKILESVDNWPDEFVLVLHGWIPDKKFESIVLSRMHSKKGKIFLSTDIVHPKEKYTIFQSADIGLVFFEPVDTNLKYAAGSSGKLYDFMRAGVPIIGNNIPGMQELVENNGCGTVVNDARELGKSIFEKIMQHYAHFTKNCLENFYRYEFGRCYERILADISDILLHEKDDRACEENRHGAGDGQEKERIAKLLNLGCGSHYKEGWINVDFNSTGPGVIAHDLSSGIPFGSNSFDVVYHSHLLEHFSKSDAKRFMNECRRVLKDGGIIRVVVPDLEQIIKWYSTLLEKCINGDQDAQKRYEWIMLELFDQMVRRVSGGEMLKYWEQNPIPAESFVIERCGSEALHAINYLRNHSHGSRREDRVAFESEMTPEQIGRFMLSGQNHQWMYDRYSLPALLKEAGFEEIRICSAYESLIPDFNSYLLDIEPDGSVRKPDSLFVEAIKKEKFIMIRDNEKRAIKIVHLCMQDFGGAGGAAYRLHRGLLSVGVNSTLLVLNKMSEDASVKVIPDTYSGPMTPCIDIPNHDSLTWQKQAQRWGTLLTHYPKRPEGLEIFRDADSDVRLELIKEVQDADVINLHWVNGVLDCKKAPFSLAGKPIVWTIHDMNPFTGGCHYTGDCRRYTTACGKCPQLGSENEHDLSNIGWRKKYDAYPLLNLHIVSPSKWLAKCASESSLFSQFPVSIIPNSCPVDTFKPYNKKDARESFQIDTSAKIILFGADSVINKRKGFIYLLKALNNLSDTEKHKVVLVTFGHLPDNVAVNIQYPVKNIGVITETKQLAMAYSMADLFVIPSVEDNLPNTVVESLSCGTPVVGFNIGGISDMIDHKENGYVAKPMDAEDLAKGINWIMSSSEETMVKLSERCRKKAEELYALEIQANKYRRLYEDIYEKHQSVRESANEINKQAKQALQRGDVQKTKELLTEVLHQSPYNVKALNNFAVARMMERDWKSAQEILQKVLQIDPANQIARENAKYLENQVYFHKSLYEVKKLIEQRNYSQAREILERMLEADDKHIDALNNLAVIDIHEKNYTTARHLLEKVLRIDNTNIIAKENITLLNQVSSLDSSPLREECNLSGIVDVSIVIATKDRSNLLDEMLTSLAKATPGLRYEVIAIEGNSSDNTLEILQKHGITQIYNETEYLGKGRHSWPQLYNFGFSKTRGKWVMYASDDIIFNDECITKAVTILNKQNTSVAGGIFFYKNVIADPGWEVFGIDFTYGQKLLMNYGLLRRTSFNEVRGLDEDYQFYCADSDLCLKLYQNGKTLIPLPCSLVKHNNILDNQKKANLRYSNLDIKLYSERWKHFVPIKLPEPRRLIWNKNMLNDSDFRNTDASLNPRSTEHAYTITPNCNILDQLRKAGMWNDGQPLRLHLGCGEKNLDGYVNIDYPPSEHNVMDVKADMYANIITLDCPAECVDEIRSHHLFEHFDRVTALATIIKWHKWLRIGGKLHIEAPDLIGSAKTLISGVSLKIKMGVVRHIAGDQAAPLAYHKDHWFAERFEHTLKELGFECRNVRHWSWKHEPYLSNVEVVAIKSRNVHLDDQLITAERLLRESTVTDGENSTHQIWTRQLHAVIKENCIEAPDKIPLPDISAFTNIPPLVSTAVSELPLEKIHDFNQKSRDKWIREKAVSIPAGSRVLDVGAGTCPYRSLFDHCDYKTHDFKKYKGVKLGNTTEYGNIDYISEITDIPVPDSSFDVILCTEVLEHVPEPIAALREMSRILRPGGRMLVTAPLGSGLHQLPYHYYGGFSPQWYRHFSHIFGLEIKEIVPNGGFFKLLAQECARVAWTLPEHQHLHDTNVEIIRNLFGNWIPRYLFALEEKHFIDQFTVGYHVDMEKSNPANASKKTVNNELPIVQVISNDDRLPANKDCTPADTHFSFFKKAEEYFSKGTYKEAIYNYQKTIEINPYFPDAYFSLAIAYAKTNQTENAIEILEKVIHLCPNDASVYNNLGALSFKKCRYLDAKTYCEIALLMQDTYKEARDNLEKVNKILKETSSAKTFHKILGLIFSKDRAMQLDGTLRSFYMHCKDAAVIDTKVIYKASHPLHKNHYEDLKKYYGNTEFITEQNFKEQVLSLLRQYTYVLFLVDDNIFLRNFHISHLADILKENTNAIGFSLRLGENTAYCYTVDSPQNIPAFTHIPDDILKYDWTSAERDFGYPLEVSSSLYRVKELYPLLVQINFSNPNILENQMDANKRIYASARPMLLCNKLSLTFCAPVNKVQDVCENRSGNEHCYSREMLAIKFGEGYRIDIEKYAGFTPNACHQEISLDFVNTNQ